MRPTSLESSPVSEPATIEQPVGGIALQPGTTELKIPSLVKRNTALLAVSQTFSGAGHGMIYSLGALMVVELLGSASLAGIGLAILGVTRFLIAYPLGKLTDTYGRKPGLFFGLGMSVVGALIMGSSMLHRSLPLYVLGMLCMGVSTGAAHQLRVAAADMYPPSRRAEGLGWVLTGSLLGIFGTPMLVVIADRLAPALGIHPIGMSWVLVPLIALPGVLLIAQVRPDPKEIASHLERYYPGYEPARQDAGGTGEQVSMREFLAHFPKQVAMVTNFAAQGNMAITMVVMSLLLSHHGHRLPEITLSMSLHSIGMFGFSLPLGRLADRLGRRTVLLGGVIVAVAGTLLVTMTVDFWMITLGGFLVGLGWSAVNVASTAVLADTSRSWERGRAIGTNDTFGGASAVALSLFTGPMAAALGYPSTGILGIVLVIPALVMLLGLREPRPGLYEGRAAH
jgi:MFS family permease